MSTLLNMPWLVSTIVETASLAPTRSAFTVGMPEPETILLILLAGGLFLARHRRLARERRSQNRT
jgi:hypothetical protein